MSLRRNTIRAVLRRPCCRSRLSRSAYNLSIAVRTRKSKARFGRGLARTHANPHGLGISHSYRRQAPAPPHVAERGLEPAREIALVHQRRDPHPLPHSLTQAAKPLQVAGELHGRVAVFLGGFRVEAFEADLRKQTCTGPP